MVVESTLGRAREAVSEVALMRSFESSSSILLLEVESLLERRFLRMQRVSFATIPIFGDFGHLEILVLRCV